MVLYDVNFIFSIIFGFDKQVPFWASKRGLIKKI